MTSPFEQPQPGHRIGGARRRPSLVPLLLLIPLTLAGLLLTWLGQNLGLPFLAPVAFIPVVAVTMILTRRHTVPALIGVAAVVLLLSFRWAPTGVLFPLLLPALATAVIRSYRTAAWITAAIAFTALSVLIPLTAGPVTVSPIRMLVIGALFAGTLVIAAAVASRRQRLAELNRRRAGEERLLIARELHDVMAHNISLINVQSGVALHLMDDDPQQARTALAAIKTASRETLRELRSTLGVMRGVDEDAPRAPAPSLIQLDELTGTLAAAGLQVAVSHTGGPRELPASIDLAAYRIIQESLTNVHRHAGAAAAEVRIDYGMDRLTIEITDEGAGGVPAEGNGLAGMRERVASLGGSMTAGPRTDGRPGFTVQAILPLTGHHS